MSRAQRHTLSQVSGKNCFPTDTARFSRQLLPLRASCSLSAYRKKLVNGRVVCINKKLVIFIPTLLHTPKKLVEYVIKQNRC